MKKYIKKLKGNCAVGIDGICAVTAISLLHDVGTYCINNGSQMYTCSLDAKGVFDAIPFPVLFAKSMNIIPDICWRFLYKWYNNMNVRIKWYGLSRPIVVSKGTTQGGLTSPYLFNIFYRELIEVLSKNNTGIKIENKKYNVFCYADDILLSSTTITGLQTLIDVSVNFIEHHGLRFNPIKTSCFIRGKHPFLFKPEMVY